MKRDQFIQELITALSQTTPLPEPEDFPEKAEHETIVGDASPPVQALIHLYVRLQKSLESATEETAEDILRSTETVSELAMTLANLERDNQELLVSGFVKGWKLAHDPNDYMIVFN